MDSKPIYKTAEQLGIDAFEYDGLIALIGPLSRNELPFSMKSTCGSICCIGGWVAAIDGRRNEEDQNSYVLSREGHHSLNELYFPCGGWLTSLPYKAKGAQAARAIVNFLVTGDPQWSAVMSEAA